MPSAQADFVECVLEPGEGPVDECVQSCTHDVEWCIGDTLIECTPQEGLGPNNGQVWIAGQPYATLDDFTFWFFVERAPEPGGQGCVIIKAECGAADQGWAMDITYKFTATAESGAGFDHFEGTFDGFAVEGGSIETTSLCGPGTLALYGTAYLFGPLATTFRLES